jgi:N-acetyl-alpha-D-muramate 1-phosphate uridylyltransferase
VTLPVAVLAGGKATRLYPVTEAIPKSLVEVAGRPFIQHQIELLRRNHIERIVICLGFLGEQVEATLGDGSAFGLQIAYVHDGPTLLGTGGALKRALPALGKGAFFVLYGDSFLDIDYAFVEDEFVRSGKTGLMTVHGNQGKWDRSNVYFAQGEIVEYEKKNPTPEMQHIDYGLGILQEAAFEDVPDDQAYDLADIYKNLIKKGQLAGYEVQQRFYEIGSPEGLAETRAYLTEKVGARRNSE